MEFHCSVQLQAAPSSFLQNPESRTQPWLTILLSNLASSGHCLRMSFATLTSKASIGAAVICGCLAPHSAAALYFPLPYGNLAHEFTPEVIITMPGNPPSQFRVAPQATDTANCNSGGASFNAPGGVLALEFALLAPDGFHFSIDPGLLTYQFGFDLDISHTVAGPSFGNVTARFIGASVDPVISIIGRQPSQTGNVTTLFGLSDSPPAGPFTFAGLLIGADLVTGANAGPFILDSASFGIFTRNLAVNADPGIALSLVPVPEPAPSTLCLVAAALLLTRRNRRDETQRT